MKRVLALTRESHVAWGVPSLSVSARVTEALDFLKDEKQLEYITVSEKNPIAMNALDWCDVLIMSKHNSLHAMRLAVQAKKIGVKVIYDFDDWIFSFPGYSGGNKQHLPDSYINEIIGCADVVTVANDFLKSALADKGIETTLLPNGMYVNKYIGEDSGFYENRKKKIVFANADFLKVNEKKEELVSAIQQFFIERPEYTLDFYGDPFPELFMMPFAHFTKRVPYQEFIRMLLAGGYQFSIVPLGADEDVESIFFNNCKNPFKYLNYGSVGIPGIYSTAKIYTDVVNHNDTGLLVNNSFGDWYSALVKMADNTELRQRISRNAFIDVCSNHDIKNSAKVLLGLM
jgi:processive 1,2-diacylglycerol beta-glucosyltransferase